MSKLTNKEIKELLKKIEVVLNEHEPWEEEFWIYKLELKKNEIECKIYDDEWLEYIIKIDKDYNEYNFSKNTNINTTTILKSLISYLYDKEINHRQAFIKGTDAYNRRKIKSMSNWSSKGKEDKVKDINEEIIARFNIAKRVKSELEPFKTWVSDFYRVLNKLEPYFKTEEIFQAIWRNLREFNISDVGVNYKKDTITVTIFDNEKEEMKDSFNIIVDSYSNISTTVNNVIQQIRKLVA